MTVVQRVSIATLRNLYVNGLVIRAYDEEPVRDISFALSKPLSGSYGTTPLANTSELGLLNMTDVVVNVTLS
jgi:hypothetical protein